jgi:hypothetical protein
MATRIFGLRTSKSYRAARPGGCSEGDADMWPDKTSDEPTPPKKVGQRCLLPDSPNSPSAKDAAACGEGRSTMTQHWLRHEARNPQGEPALRRLYPSLDRARLGAGVQFARQPAGSLGGCRWAFWRGLPHYRAEPASEVAHPGA